MTLTQLRTFAAVARAGSVVAAAAGLHVTQPAVSSALRALERSLGVALVEPDGRGVRLTAAGEVFAGYVHRLLGLLEEAELAARGGSDPGRGRLRLAAVTTASEHVLPRSLALFRRTFPAVEVTLEVGTKAQVWQWMADHGVDVALAGRPPGVEDLWVRAVRENVLVVVAAPGFVPLLATGDPVGLEALGDTTWLLREPGSGTRETQTAMLAASEVEPPTLTLGSNGAVVAGAVAGLGVTLMSRDAVAPDLTAGTLEVVQVAATPVARPWHLVTRRAVTPTAALFVNHLLDAAVGHPEPRFVPATHGRGPV
ncbi:LysR family transcriptional regulator [soil metagenome]